MATKDRTSLKNDFANGKYATGEKFADLIDSMKVVQLPVVDPQALGTSLTFIDSISQDADGKITATKKTLDLANAHELNPFKGWYKTGDTLPTDGFDGAYLYFKDTSEQTGLTTIYRWNGTTYADTGTVVDTSNVQTFETGQAVNVVAVKDFDGNNDQTAAGVLSAESGNVLARNIFDYEEIDLSGYTPQGWVIGGANKWTNESGTSVMVPVNAGEVYFISSAGNAYVGVLSSLDWPTTNGSDVSFATGYTERIVITNDTKVITIPEDGVALCIRMTGTTVSTAPDSFLKRTGTLLEKEMSELGKVGDSMIGVSEEIELANYPKSNYIINGAKKWITSAGTSIMVGVMAGEKYIIDPINGVTSISVLTRDVTPHENNQDVTNFAEDYQGRITIGLPYEITIPADGCYLNVRTSSTGYPNITPKITHILNSTIKEDIDTVKHASTSEQDVDYLQYEVAGRVGANSPEYLSAGSSYLIPVGDNAQVKVGDTIKIICELFADDTSYSETIFETMKVYVSFLKEAPVVGQNVVTADNVLRHIFTDSTIGQTIVVPNDTVYVLMLKQTSSTAAIHNPYTFTRMAGGIDPDKLVKGTFNSSYNEIDTSTVEDEFCGYILGKNNIETFLFFTDPHLTPHSRYEEMSELVRDKYISVLQKYYNSLPIDTIICGGDLLNYHDSKTEAISSLGYADAYMRKLFKRYYPIMGNHDMRPYRASGPIPLYDFANALSMTEVKNAMFRENGNTYYSFDGLKVKFYILDSGVSFDKRMTFTPQLTNSYGNYSQLSTPRWEQIAWLAGKLAEDDANCSVIALHIYSNAGGVEADWFSNATGMAAKGIHEFGHNVKLLAEAYNNRGQITLNSVTYNFTGATGHVMFMICGHTHVDYVDCSGDLPVIAVTDIEGGYFNGTNTSYALVPTFDCCMLDIDNSVLYMTRVGVKNSRIVNCEKVSVAAGSTTALTSKLTGTLTWSVQARYSGIVSVNDGVVTGISAGYAGVVATDANGREEYFIVQCS